MGAVGLRLRAEARAQWRAWLGVALLVGVVSGATISAFAGARRTQTAYNRFLVGTHAFDMAISNGSGPETTNRQFDLDEVARRPEVADATRWSYYFPSGTTAAGKQIRSNDIAPFGSAVGRFGQGVNGVRVLHGRLPVRSNEVAMSLAAADEFGVRAGETVRLDLAGPRAAAAGRSDGLADFLVTGIVVTQGGFPPRTGGLPPVLLLTPAYVRAHPDAAQLLVVRLRAGTRGIPAFERVLNRLSAGGPVLTINQHELSSAVQRGIDVESTALRLLGLVVAGVTLLLLGQALTRLRLALSDDDDVLRGLGFTRTQLSARSLGRGVAIGIGAAVTAAATAVLLSPLTPVGVARQAELHPGIAVNVAYVGIGAATVFAIVALLSVIPAWWTSRSWSAARRSTVRVTPGFRLSTVLAPVGRSPEVGAGVRMALEPGRGRASVPVRSTMISAILGVAAVAGVLCFSASLTRLLREPRLYGWNWDVQVGDSFAPDLRPEAARVRRASQSAAVAVGTITRLRIGGVLVDSIALEPVKGALQPTVVEGRVPARPSEIMLGARTLDDVGLHVGDTARVSVGNRSVRRRVVGRGVLPDAGAARLGEGAMLTFDGIRDLVKDPVADVVLVRVRPGPAGERLVADLADTKIVDVYLPAKPSDLVDLGRVGGLPSIVVALLALMAVATLAHALFSSARRRRRDLAILKVLGFRRRQVSAAIAWQATVVALIAVVVGLPLGIGAGRWVWREFAQRLGVPDQPVTPVLAIAAVAVFTLLIAVVTAAIPASMAGRTRAAAVLRSE